MPLAPLARDDLGSFCQNQLYENSPIIPPRVAVRQTPEWQTYAATELAAHTIQGGDSWLQYFSTSVAAVTLLSIVH